MCTSITCYLLHALLAEVLCSDLTVLLHTLPIMYIPGLDEVWHCLHRHTGSRSAIYSNMAFLNEAQFQRNSCDLPSWIERDNYCRETVVTQTGGYTTLRYSRN